MNLLGEPDCVLADGPAVAFVTDEWDTAWLCAAHLGRLEILQRSIGRTIGAYLREMTGGDAITHRP